MRCSPDDRHDTVVVAVAVAWCSCAHGCPVLARPEEASGIVAPVGPPHAERKTVHEGEAAKAPPNGKETAAKVLA